MERLIVRILLYFWKETKQNLQSKHFISLNAHNVHIMTVINTVTSDNKILLIKALCPERQEY